MIQCNFNTLNYLEVMVKFNKGSYYPYRELNNRKNYINSAHQPSITV